MSRPRIALLGLIVAFILLLCYFFPFLRIGSSVSGVVRDGKTGAPIADVAVSAIWTRYGVPENKSRFLHLDETKTDSHGYFNLPSFVHFGFDVLRAAEPTLLITKKGFIPLVVKNMPADLDYVLPQNGYMIEWVGSNKFNLFSGVGRDGNFEIGWVSVSLAINDGFKNKNQRCILRKKLPELIRNMEDSKEKLELMRRGYGVWDAKNFSSKESCDK